MLRSVLATILLGLCWRASAAPWEEKITVIERANSDTIIYLNISNPKDTFGNGLIFANDLYDETNTTIVGKDQGYCSRTKTGSDGAWECRWTTILKDGQLTVEGPLFDQLDSVLTITGGTGEYRAVRGEMKLDHLDANNTLYAFTYTFYKEADPESLSRLTLLAVFALVIANVAALMACFNIYKLYGRTKIRAHIHKHHGGHKTHQHVARDANSERETLIDPSQGAYHI